MVQNASGKILLPTFKESWKDILRSTGEGEMQRSCQTFCLFSQLQRNYCYTLLDHFFSFSSHHDLIIFKIIDPMHSVSFLNENWCFFGGLWYNFADLKTLIGEVWKLKVRNQSKSVSKSAKIDENWSFFGDLWKIDRAKK